MVQDGIALLLAESNAYLDDYTNNSHLLILVAFKVAKKATKTYASTKLKAEEGVVQDEITNLISCQVQRSPSSRSPKHDTG